MPHRLTLLLALASCASRGPALDLPPDLADTAPARPAAEEHGAGYYGASFPTMGTMIQLELGAEDADAAAAAVQAARDELARLDALFSEWRADSPVSAVNAQAGKGAVRVPREVYELVERSLRAAERSGGAFDPTWASMRGVWKFGDAMDGEVPSDEAIERKRHLVDWRRVRLDPAAQTIALGEGQALGLGGIAKGYAVDRLVEIFRGREMSSFVVRLGGDLYAAGTRGGSPWRAGIQDPRAPGEVFAVLPIEDRAFSTSGDYERFFEADGVRYHHIIDPATGRPATASRSVTALCPDAVTAEVVTKPVFILGAAKGIPYASGLGCEVVVVDAAGRVHVSEGLQGSLDWRQPTP